MFSPTDNIQKPAKSPDCLLGVVMQPTNSPLSETRRTDEESTLALDKGRYTKGSIHAETWMNDKSVKFQIDSGATVNVLPQKYVSTDHIHPSDAILHMWNRTTREVIGKHLQRWSVRSIKRVTPCSSN